jgi:hypothetical protein
MVRRLGKNMSRCYSGDYSLLPSFLCVQPEYINTEGHNGFHKGLKGLYNLFLNTI